MKKFEHIETGEPMWRKMVIAFFMLIYSAIRACIFFVARVIYALLFTIAYVVFIILIIFWGSNMASSYMQKLLDIMKKNVSGL